MTHLSRTFIQSELLEFTLARTKLQQLGLFWFRLMTSTLVLVPLILGAVDLEGVSLLLRLASSFFTFTSLPLHTSFSELLSHCCFHILLLFSFLRHLLHVLVCVASMFNLWNSPHQQGRTGRSCRTCWPTSETRRTRLTCSLPRPLRPGPARSDSTSTKGTGPMKVLGSSHVLRPLSM